MKTRRVRKSASEGEKQERSAHLVVEDGPVSVRIYARNKRVKERDYRVFELADYSSGVRQLRSFSDEGKAIEEAKRIAELMRKGDSEGLRLDGTDRAVYVRAAEHARDLSIPLDVIRALLPRLTSTHKL